MEKDINRLNLELIELSQLMVNDIIVQNFE